MLRKCSVAVKEWIPFMPKDIKFVRRPAKGTLEKFEKAGEYTEIRRFYVKKSLKL